VRNRAKTWRMLTIGRFLIAASPRAVLCHFSTSNKEFINTAAAVALISSSSSSSTMGSLETPESVRERIAKRVSERNSWPNFFAHSFRDMIKFFTGTPSPIPSQAILDKEFPVQPVDYDLLRFPKSDLQVTWIGHATVLIQLHKHVNILTDPMFSQRCSPLQYFGPTRFRPPALTVEDLTREGIPVHAVLVSHNHYDHLDYHSLRQLAASTVNRNSSTRNNDTALSSSIQFIVPLGLKKWMEKNVPKSVEHHSTVELDWHETFQMEFNDQTLEISALPMLHWSSRMGWDRDETLWCGFGITSKKHGDVKKVLFPGDTGWFEGLKDIGEQYGPFDLAAIPIGAYEPRDFMKLHHLNPEEAVMMMKAVKANNAIPIHWGTFQLTFEPVLEPQERLIQASKDAKLREGSFKPRLIGETVIYDS
jgi:L-ascorbate metabolism protein UlaG (beta-lactamase superfamily)